MKEIESQKISGDQWIIDRRKFVAGAIGFPILIGGIGFFRNGRELPENYPDRFESDIQIVPEETVIFHEQEILPANQTTPVLGD